MRLIDIIKGSEHDLSLFSEEKTAEFESLLYPGSNTSLTFAT